MRNLSIALIVLLAAAALAYQKYFRGTSLAATPELAGAAAGGAGGGMPVEAEAAKSQDVAQEIIAVGSLRSNESVTLSSEIAGRLMKIQFTEGQPVAQGAVLFVLDDSVYRAELEQARASLMLSQNNYNRALELFERKLVSTRERDEAASKLALDKAGVALADARLAKTRIIAPFAGVIGLRLVSPGDYVKEGQALAPLEQLQLLKVDFRLSEAALSAIHVGQTLDLQVDAYPDQTFEGRVYAIDPKLAEDTRSIGVRARVPNDKGKLRPGLFARVKLVVAEHPDAVLVPEQAIVPQGEHLFVYVIEDGKAAMRPVQVGVRRAGRAEIVSGLKAGEIVITAGLQKIGPGAPVMPINLGPPAGTGDAPAGAGTPAPAAKS